MLSLILIKHGNLVDLNRAFYVMHRKNRLDYRIDPVDAAVDMPQNTARTYPTGILLSQLNEGWCLVQGNSCFDLAPIGRALSGALSTRSISILHQPLHEESGLCLCETGRELRRINRRHGRTAANGSAQSFEEDGDISADSPFGLNEMAAYVQWVGAPVDLRGDLDEYRPSFHIHSV